MVTLEPAKPSASRIEADGNHHGPGQVDDPQLRGVSFWPRLTPREEINVLSVEQLILDGIREANDRKMKDVEEERNPAKHTQDRIKTSVPTFHPNQQEQAWPQGHEQKQERWRVLRRIEEGKESVKRAP